MRAEFNTVVSFYLASGYGTVGALRAEEAGRFVSTQRIKGDPYSVVSAETYFSTVGLVAPTPPSVVYNGLGKVELSFAAADILIDNAVPGVLWNLYFSDDVFDRLGNFLYTRHHVLPYPFG